MKAVVLATVLLALATSPARADEDADKQQAVQLMTEGDAKFAAGDAKAALAKYHQAYDAFPSPKLYFVIARAEEALGKLADALTHYEQFLVEVADVKKPLRKTVGKSIAKLKSKVGIVTFQLDLEGAVITVDGKPVGAAPLDKPIYVDPGSHVFGAEANGMATARIEQSVGPGERATILLELKELPKKPAKVVPEPEPEPEPEPASVPVAKPKQKKTGFYVGLALTGAFLAGGTITGIMATMAHGDFSDESMTLEDRKAAKDSGETLAVVTDVMLVCGLAAGAYTTWYYFSKLRTGPGSAVESSASGVRVLPTVSAQGAGAAVGFDF